MNHSVLITPDEARRIALREAGISRAAFSMQIVSADMQRNLYELAFVSDDMAYCCFVDAETSEVVGFDSRPRVA